MTAPVNVLITGCSSGIGRAAAEALLERGHAVVATMRQVDGKNAGRAAELRTAGDGAPGSVYVLELDVTNDESVTAAVDVALSAVGSIDVLVSNAGFGGWGLLEGFTSEQLSLVFETNVIGTHRLNRAVLPGMRERGSGLLVHLSSAMGRIVIPYAAPYTSTKFAIEALAESLHYELAGTGVDVAILQPGAINTDFQANVQAPGDSQRVTDCQALVDRGQAFWSHYADKLDFAAKAPGAELVAEHIVQLVEAPAGSRPLRTIIDPLHDGAGTPDINEMSERVQVELMRWADAEDLLRRK